MDGRERMAQLAKACIDGSAVVYKYCRDCGAEISWRRIRCQDCCPSEEEKSEHHLLLEEHTKKVRSKNAGV